MAALGVRTYPSETYFFLADVSPSNASQVAARLHRRHILIKPLDESRLGSGFLRVTTALPADNAGFLGALRKVVAI